MAAEILESVSRGLSLRTPGTIEKIQLDPSKIVIFSLPVEILKGIKSIKGRRKSFNTEAIYPKSCKGDHKNSTKIESFKDFL